MWPERVSNPRPLTYPADCTALRGPAYIVEVQIIWDLKLNVSTSKGNRSFIETNQPSSAISTKANRFHDFFISSLIGLLLKERICS